MPPRLNKRQQRGLEELEALGGGLSGGRTPVDTDSEEDALQAAKAQSAFAAVRILFALSITSRLTKDGRIANGVK